MVEQRTFSKFYKFHIYLGLFVSVHFLLFALTGFALLFKDELSANPAAVATPLSSDALATGYDRTVSDLQKRFPQDRVLALFPDEHSHDLLHARLGAGGATALRGSKRATYDLHSGAAVERTASPQKGIFDFLLQLHKELFLGSFGKIYVGFLGLCYVALLITGFLIYGRFMKGRDLGALRAGPIGKSADLHKFIGATTFGWSLIVGLTGTLLAFNSYILKIFQWQSLRHLSAVYKTTPATGDFAPMSRVIETALATRPESAVSYVSFPGSEYGIPGHFLVLVNGTTRLTEHLIDVVVVNAATGQLTEIVSLPFYLKALVFAEPLHFGNYGGLFLKCLWALFTMGSLAVVVMGVRSFWLKKRRRKPAENLGVSRTGTGMWARTPRSALAVFAVCAWTGVFGSLFAAETWLPLFLAVLAISPVVFFLKSPWKSQRKGKTRV